MENREEGYYWVRQANSDSWEVAHYVCLYSEKMVWLFTGDDSHHYGYDIDEIGDKIAHSSDEEPPTHKCKFNEIEKNAMMCECGAIMVREGMFSEEDIKQLKEWHREPHGSIMNIDSGVKPSREKKEEE